MEAQFPAVVLKEECPVLPLCKRCLPPEEKRCVFPPNTRRFPVMVKSISGCQGHPPIIPLDSAVELGVHWKGQVFGFPFPSPVYWHKPAGVVMRIYERGTHLSVIFLVYHAIYHHKMLGFPLFLLLHDPQKTNLSQLRSQLGKQPPATFFVVTLRRTPQ